MSRRDGAIVAWREVPGTAPPQKSRPLGYGVIGGGVRTDSMIGVTKFPNAFGSGILIFENAFGRNYAWQQGYGAFSVGIRRFRKRSIEQQLEHHRTRTFQEEYLALRNTAPISTRNTSGIGCARSYRTLRDGSFEGRFPRHFVPGYDRGCPYGTCWQTFRNSI